MSNTISFPRQYARTRRFTVGRPRTFAVTPDGGRVLFLRSPSEDDATLSLWALDRATGEEAVLVDPAELGVDDADLPAAERARRERARESAEGIVGYAMSGSGRIVAFALAGELFVLDLESGAVHALQTNGQVFDPRPNHEGTWIAYVSGRELRVVSADPAASETDRVLAGEDDPLVSWGRADFVAAEEMGRSRGYWWSPAGDAVLACRVGEHDVPKWWISDPANPDREPVENRYPVAGADNPTVDLFLIGLDGSERRIAWVDQPDDYLADVAWSGSHAPLVVRQPRHQRCVEILDIDLESVVTGDDDSAPNPLTLRHRIDDEHWVELIPGSPSWLDDALLTIEDHAALDRRVLCVDGEPVGCDRELHAKSILGTVNGQVIITAWTHPTEVHVIAVDPDSGTTTMLSNEPGVYGGAVGAKGTIVVTGSRPTVAGTTTSVLDLSAGTIDPANDEPSNDGPSNDRPANEIRSVEGSPAIECTPEFIELAGLHASVLLPNDHDGSSPLPVLLDPYGGPHAQRVIKAHGGHLVSQWFADQGYAVLVVDGRGTPGRGPAFERAVWGDVAQPVLDDQIAALDAAAEHFGFLDLDRVGIRGWSFGGYLAALAVLRRPDRVHAAIAGAPVTTWRLYDTHYTERYLGHPDQHPTHYDQTDLILEADRLERPLMLIHGLADDNVVAAHTLRFSSALLAAGRAHEVLPLSGVTHMTPQEVVAENLLHLQRDFLAANLVNG